MHLDLPDIPDVSQIYGGPSVGRGDTNEGLNILQEKDVSGITSVDW